MLTHGLTEILNCQSVHLKTQFLLADFFLLKRAHKKNLSKHNHVNIPTV